MRPYHVASTYDPMVSLPYTDIAAYLTRQFHTYQPHLQTIWDIACGTGNLTLPLAQAGFQVKGLDISPEMLAIAQNKASSAQLNIPFVCQDMCEAYPGELVDAVTCLYGGLNFLNSTQALKQALAQVYAALKPGGLFVFDQFSADKMRAAFTGTRAGDWDDFSVVTRSQWFETGLITHRVTFFLREPDGRYRRDEEEHHLRSHPFDELCHLLKETGFNVLQVAEIYPQVNHRLLQDVYLFVAQKPLNQASDQRGQNE